MIKLKKLIQENINERLELPPESYGKANSDGLNSNVGISKFDENFEETPTFTLEYFDDALAGLEESEASAQAKKLGLKHRGFGRYSKDAEGPIMYQTKNGKLAAYIEAGTEQDKPKDDTIGGKTEKEKEEEKRHIEKRKTGLTNVKRIRSERGKAAYSFKYNGESGEMVLTKNEYKLMVKKHISPSKIILARIEKSQEEKKHPKMGASEKALAKKKAYKLQKQQLGKDITKVKNEKPKRREK